MSIRNQIVVLIILMTILPLGIIVYTAIKQQQHEIEEALAITASVASQVQNDQNVLLAGAEQLAATVSILPVVKQHDAAAVNSLLDELVKTNPRINNIIIVDKTGALWASAIPSKGPLSYADRRYFKNAVATGKISSGEYSIGKIFQAPIIGFAYPIKDHSGTVTDVMTVVISLDTYSQLYTGENATPASSILLVDHKGTILYSSADSRLTGKQDRADLFKIMVEGPAQGSFEAVGNLGIKRFFSYRRLKLKDESAPYMYIRTGLNKDYVLANARKDFLLGAGIILPTMFIMLGLAIYFCKQGILDKISALLKATQKIADGDLQARVPDLFSGGELYELGHSFNDMAQRIQQASEAQRESEGKYRELVENANSIILKLDTEGRITFFNEYAQHFFGFSEAEILGQNVIGTIVPATESTGRDLVEMVQGIFAYPDVYTHSINENTRKNGERVWVSWSNHAFVNADGSKAGILSIGQDISERKQSEEKFSTIFHASPDAIILSRFHDGMMLDVNASFTRITGFTSDQAIGKTSREIGLWNDFNDRVRLEAVINRYGEISCFEAYFKTRVGSNLLGQISGRTIEIDGTLCLLSIIRDITERDYILWERIKAQKLESISVLAGGIAHNFNNVLTGVIGYISYAKKNLGDAAKVLQILDAAEKSSYRAAGIARQLLTFSQGGPTVKESVSVDSLVQEAVSLFLSGSNIKGDVECASHQTITVDSQQISQAFNNIVLNAVHSMPDGGTLAVRVDRCSLDENNRYSLPSGDYVHIVFADSGCGIKKDDLIKVFDPYFTTRDSGTGLGLSTTHSIVSEHGGHIDIASEVGKGTTVTIILPSLPEELIDDKCSTDHTKKSQGTGSILVMDDEEMIRNITEEMLGGLGYQVATCSDGEEACTLYRESREAGETFSAVIVDLSIPAGMGGIETAQHILGLDPQACLIASSGYSNDPAVVEYRAFGFRGSIAKPYSSHELANAVINALKACPSS